jgi:hypothetical protein
MGRRQSSTGSFMTSIPDGDSAKKLVRKIHINRIVRQKLEGEINKKTDKLKYA